MGWLTATEALSVLGVRPQTLYANVSRRRIRARPDPKDPRRSLYHEADVRKLARSRSGARKAERVAAGAIEWGDPILPSAISTVAHGRLWYRGQDAVELAETRTLEEIASLLWEGPAVGLQSASGPASEKRLPRSRNDSSNPAPSLPRMFAAIADRAGRDPPSHGRTLAVLRSEAAEVLALLAGSAIEAGQAGPLHEWIAATWQCKRAADVLRRTLVLLADHELNASTFAVRVTVSTGASLASGVLSGLSTLSGPLHGRASVGVHELVQSGRQRGMRAAVREWLEYGRPLSGFGHPLYSAGDVRAAALTRGFHLPPEYRELSAAVDELAGERPNIDFALAAMTASFRLPAEAPLVLFALARSVGWLAHAMEQAAAGRLIRPRARYIGPPVPAP
ncbi:MAG: citrate synthase family protein [Gammaproteobacteria bacterium]|nr:citrate synthase family protein [Gammaproteobacteria bacterium]